MEEGDTGMEQGISARPSPLAGAPPRPLPLGPCPLPLVPRPCPTSLRRPCVPDVGHAGKDVAGVVVKDVLERQRRLEEVPGL